MPPSPKSLYKRITPELLEKVAQYHDQHPDTESTFNGDGVILTTSRGWQITRSDYSFKTESIMQSRACVILAGVLCRLPMVVRLCLCSSSFSIEAGASASCMGPEVRSQLAFLIPSVAARLL